VSIFIDKLINVAVNFTPAILVDRIGHKWFILLAMLPKLGGALLMLFATKIWMLIVGRALDGISVMNLFTVIPAYASEIASVIILILSLAL
jgi:MFS family permease